MSVAAIRRRDECFASPRRAAFRDNRSGDSQGIAGKCSATRGSVAPGRSRLLRIFIGEDDHHKRSPLYEEIVLKARDVHLAGATLIRGFLGFGKSSHLHTERILRLSMDLPMVIEIVDVPEKVNAFLRYLEPMMSSGLVTVERARVVRRKQAAAQKRIVR
jgi:uncharacterized protein